MIDRSWDVPPLLPPLFFFLRRLRHTKSVVHGARANTKAEFIGETMDPGESLKERLCFNGNGNDYSSQKRTNLPQDREVDSTLYTPSPNKAIVSQEELPLPLLPYLQGCRFTTLCKK